MYIRVLGQRGRQGVRKRVKYIYGVAADPPAVEHDLTILDYSYAY